jgi:uncharacterized membrane protein/protein-disulfide isomerase
MTRKMRNLVVMLALLGLGASTASAYVHYRLLRDPSYTSFCDVSATVSCQAVYESPFGTVRGIPVAVGGVIWFTLVLLLAVADSGGDGKRRPQDGLRSSVQGYLFVLSTLALAVVLYLGYASFAILKAVCILCVLTYVAVIGIFLIVGGGNDVPVRSLPGRAARDIRAMLSSPAALVLALLFVAGSVSLVAFFPRDTGIAVGKATTVTPPPVLPEAQGSEFERWYASQPRVPVAEPSDGAAVVIVKFNDYQCPACGTTYMNYRPILAKWHGERPGAVKFVAKDYPLDPKCNPNVTTAMHGAACDAAVAVRLSRARNRADAMEEWLYTHQTGLTTEAVKQAARDIGGVTDFDARYPATIELIKGDIRFATQLGVRVTPTFYINGVKVEGGLRPEYFDAAISSELKRAGQASSARPH